MSEQWGVGNGTGEGMAPDGGERRWACGLSGIDMCTTPPMHNGAQDEIWRRGVKAHLFPFYRAICAEESA
jgi:hypothetical protein